jgi:hypothetical protein
VPPARPGLTLPPARSRAPRPELAYTGPRDLDALQARARELNREYRAAHHRRIPLAKLRAALACNQNLASSIHQMLKREEEQVA